MNSDNKYNVINKIVYECAYIYSRLRLHNNMFGNIWKFKWCFMQLVCKSKLVKKMYYTLTKNKIEDQLNLNITQRWLKSYV